MTDFLKFCLAGLITFYWSDIM